MNQNNKPFLLAGWLFLQIMPEQKLTPQQALPKIKQYCAYQERCHSEVMEKLYSYGLHKTEAEEMIGKLATENYLNEERFALTFAGGKFRAKQWGRVKIKYQLRQKQVSDHFVKKALAGIDDKEYIKTLIKLAHLKLKHLKNERNLFIKNKKLYTYLKMKGYEGDLINDVVNELVK